MDKQEKSFFLAHALTHAANPMLIIDKGAKVVWINRAYERFAGVPETELVGNTPRFLRPDGHRKEFFRTLWKTVFYGNTWMGELLEFRGEQETVPVECVITPLVDTAGRPSNFLVSLHDISKHKTQLAMMSHQANHDPLTGLANRAMFNSVVAHTVAQSKRSGSTCALMFLDLDGFKAVNDTYGHHAGDTLLIEIATRLKRGVRASDTVSRLAGDEFAILLDNVDGGNGATVIATKILERMMEPVTLDSGAVRVGASIGIALYPDDALTPETLLRKADEAMYAAKRTGKNKFVFHRDLGTPAEEAQCDVKDPERASRQVNNGKE